MTTVQVPSQHHRFFGCKLLQVFSEMDIPLLQSIVQALETIARVGYVGIDHIHIWILCCDEPPLLVMLFFAHAILYGDRLGSVAASQHDSTGSSLAGLNM